MQEFALQPQRFYYPSDQASLEAAMVRQRRQALDSEAVRPDTAARLQAEGTESRQTPDEADRATVMDSKGLALSGGGIRSATFNLGLLQALAAAGQLKNFDFLSTVSGGGYIGACLGRLYERSAHEQAQVSKVPPDAAQTARDVEQVLASDEAPLIRWLRDHGRYLAPQGLKDRLFALAIYLRNILTVHVLLGMLLLGTFLAWGMLQMALLHTLQRMGLLDSLLQYPHLLEFMRQDPELLQLMRQNPMSAGTDLRRLQVGQGYSPAWLLAGMTLLTSLGCAWAYWMHRHESNRGLDRAGLEQRGVALALALGSASALPYLQDQSSWLAALPWAGLLTALLALIFPHWPLTSSQWSAKRLHH